MADHPLLDVLLSITALAVLVAWVGCLFMMFGDIFRSPDLAGTAKAGWALLVFVLPLLGVLLYLVARGRGMHDRAMEDAVRREGARRELIRPSSAAVRPPDGVWR
jgi:hypothetical protein